MNNTLIILFTILLIYSIIKKDTTNISICLLWIHGLMMDSKIRDLQKKVEE